MPRHSSSGRILRFECLESKLSLSGNAAVMVLQNAAYISGDDLDNRIEIVQSGDRLVVSGLDGTTLNGKTDSVVLPAKVHSLSIDLKKGNDTLRIHEASIPAQGKNGSLNIAMGSGNDTCELAYLNVQGKLLFQGGPGNGDRNDNFTYDSLFTNVVSVSGDAAVNMGDLGNKWIQGYSTTIGGKLSMTTGSWRDYIAYAQNGPGTWGLKAKAASIDTGAGVGDRVDLNDLDVRNGLQIRSPCIGYGDVRVTGSTVGDALSVDVGRKGDKVVWIEDCETGSLALRAGDGISQIYLGETKTTRGGATIQTGGGDDSVSVWNLDVWKDLKISTGSGRDAVTLFETHVGGALTIDARYAGPKYVSVFMSEVGSLSIATGDDGDEVYFGYSSATRGPMSVQTGGGNDNLAVVESDLAGTTTIDLGGGDDTLDLNEHNVFRKRISLRGGLGNDLLRLRGTQLSEFRGGVAIVSIEHQTDA